MKNLLCLVFFLVTWSEWEAKLHPGNPNIAYTTFPVQFDHDSCSIEKVAHSEMFETLQEAREFVSKNKGEQFKFDFKISRVEEVR